ncbi:membrane protein FAM174B [Scyliorhinus canicula]|uniref:membrane protein FAM174B n=1 Tax=Scyliorhinus canicula TaxID=7830 RepID=UPI0018F2E4EA|nr:membrane protein FAM174B [Scyliorhinus canicula]
MCRWGLCVWVPLVLLLAAETSSVFSKTPAVSAPLSRNGTAASRSNGTTTALDNVASLLHNLSTLKNLVLAACAGAFLLIVCLLVRVIRSGRKIKKTRKYDIITTPAEKVEMTPLNEEDDDDEDATVFDVKYSR